MNVEFSTKEINKIVIENLLKMFERRGYIDKWEDEMKKILQTGDLTKNIIDITNSKGKFSINIVTAKLSSINQDSQLNEYLSTNINTHKFIIMKEATKKIVKQVVSEYKNSELFFESEMLEDIPSKIFIPEHKLLNEEERTELLSKFNENELSKIHIADMMARYYGAKVGDIFRITRPSLTAGKNIFYRRVVNSSWDILF